MTCAFTAAAVQFEPTMADKARNLGELARLIESAADQGAELIVTPEMGTTGYCWHDREEVSPFVEPVPGPTTEHLAEIARRRNCFIVVGLPEVDPVTDLYYNSAVLIGPDGVVGKHRKTHPYISEPKWAASGDLGHQVFETRLGRIALLICMDIHFIETARLAALGGADVICHISNWLAERTPAPYWISRAFENGCYLIESNRWGLERGVQFSGGSCIIAPEAEILAVIDAGDGIATASIDPGRARRRQMLGEPIIDQRRPELYKELMTNTFAWNPGDFFSLYGHKPLPKGARTKLAVAEFEPVADIQQNLARIEALAREAQAEGAELVVFPERALTGLERPAETAVAVDGEAVGRLAGLAASLRLHLVAGFAERDGTTFYNSALVAGPDGIIGTYRQTHLTEGDRQWATPGDAWAVFDLPFGRMGVLVGHDASFPEAGRILAIRGCDIVVSPSALRQGFHGGHAGTAVVHPNPIPMGADPVHWHQFRVRAGENNCYFAFANVRSANGHYPGLSGVFGPDTFAFPRQEAIATSEKPVAVAPIDTGNLDSAYPTNVVRRKDLVLMRQPHFYRALVV
ncbi:MAG: nitrilase-related carbon-nitrogen hydrolase [Aurantimonas endophytica]|uniref:Putative amidohydrolase n=1 Tax=Aurantimonas endophytica TaxID=1522175 RepID=A0A7W6HE61_9HYPH|nr:nitrilase-related carbon-nitrogen hydrolase [Aurantimonas endophytica]MBB4003427.1 putative amidohydrolase [Aurantimonas endophytica]MCO6404288.1 amidohydrolase [Aurantimonas endophytica]